MILCSWRRMAYYTTEPHRRLWCLLLLGVPDYWRWGELLLEVLKPDIKVQLGAVQRAHQRPGSDLKMNTGNKIVGNFTCFHEIFRRALARKSWDNFVFFFFTVHRTQTSAEKLALSVASECADVAYVCVCVCAGVKFCRLGSGTTSWVNAFRTKLATLAAVMAPKTNDYDVVKSFARLNQMNSCVLFVCF